MARTIPPETYRLIEVAGALARAGGRPLDDCPHDPDGQPGAYASWCRGWLDAGPNSRKVPVHAS